MFPHTNILTGGCVGALTLLLQTECLYYCCDRNRKDNLAGSWHTEELLWKRPSWALFRSRFVRKRTLPVDRTGTDFWFQAERSLSTPSKKSTRLKWWQLFPAVLRLTLSTLLKHFTSTSNTTDRIICCLFMLKWRLEPSHYELSPSPNGCPHTIWW